VSSILSKFNREQGDNHQGKLLWPGDMEGIPLRLKKDQPAPMLKQQETEELEHTQDFHFQMFDLADDKQREQYQYVMDRIVAGWFRCLTRQHHYDSTSNTMRVYLEWTQVYAVPPPNAQ
jgi:hypothetical protein